MIRLAEKKTRKLVHGNEKKHVSKKTIIISSVIAGILVIASVVLGVLFGLGVFNKDEEKYTYFSDLADRKLNTVEVLNKIEDKEHVFLFVYNNNELDGKQGENDTEFSEEDQEIIDQITNLAKVVDEKNESVGRDLFYLYLVDTSVQGNETIYGNSSLGGIAAEEDPAITYFFNGTNSTTVPEDLENKLPENKDANDYTITYKGTNKKLLISCLKDSKIFIRDLLA